MKKIIMILAALLVLPLATGICFAASTTQTHTDLRTFPVVAATSGQPDCMFNLSKFVSFAYTSPTANGYQTYSIVTTHWSGDKEYGTASDTTLLYWRSTTGGVDVNVSELGSGNSTDINTSGTWTNM